MTKTFDCVEMKTKAQEALQEEIGHLGPEETKEFWKQSHERLLASIAASQSQFGHLSGEARMKMLDDLIQSGLEVI